MSGIRDSYDLLSQFPKTVVEVDGESATLRYDDEGSTPVVAARRLRRPGARR